MFFKKKINRNIFYVLRSMLDNTNFVLAIKSTTKLVTMMLFSDEGRRGIN